MGAEVTPDRREQLLDLARNTPWYHSMELAPDLVTEGEFDLRDLIERYELPRVLAGKRVADVGTFNGFWAFEMERRGAEVVAIDLPDAADIDWPAFRPRPERTSALGAGFDIAHELFGSTVKRVKASVYELDPGELGDFDLVFCGSLLIHLKDQFRALERMRSILRPGGTFISAEPYDRLTSLLPFPVARYRAHRAGAAVFWEPSLRTWPLMIEASGFTGVRRVSRFVMRSPRGYAIPHAVHHATA
jgi:tRNA (mo5U34)-methyltransferase